MKLIRGSEVSDFLRCRLRWNYSWVEGLTSKTPSKKLFFGTLFHKFLEVYYVTGSAADGRTAAMELFRETDMSSMEQVDVDELHNMFDVICLRYWNQWRRVDQKRAVLATELRFAIPLVDEVYYEGTVDLVYLVDDGKLWLEDHKTVKSMTEYEDKAATDRQITRYIWAMNELTDGVGLVWDAIAETWVPIKEHPLYTSISDKKVEGFSYNLIAKEFPHAPELLKSGGLSVAKNQKTTSELYLQSIDKYGLRQADGSLPEKYETFISFLREREAMENRYFRRVEVRRNAQELDSAMQEFFWTSKDLNDVRGYIKHGMGYKKVYRNITSNCSWDCRFYQLCHAGMDGSDVQYLINQFYTKENVYDIHTETTGSED